jgi:hypothetical protein
MQWTLLAGPAVGYNLPEVLIARIERTSVYRFALSMLIRMTTLGPARLRHPMTAPAVVPE